MFSSAPSRYLQSSGRSSADITTSTRDAIGCELMNTIRETSFCIVGCGAVGATFAEMLVRTGATNIALIDGDRVKIKNLNRVFGFMGSDDGQCKVDVIAERLQSINGRIEKPRVVKFHLKPERKHESSKSREARALVLRSNVIIIAMDDNESRKICEEFCRNDEKDYLSVGIRFDICRAPELCRYRFDKKRKSAQYECSWRSQSPDKIPNANRGYGPDNGSYASVVLEATSVAFNLMLYHLENPNSSSYRYYYKRYRNFRPVFGTTKNFPRALAAMNNTLDWIYDVCNRYSRKT